MNLHAHHGDHAKTRTVVAALALAAVALSTPMSAFAQSAGAQEADRDYLFVKSFWLAPTHNSWAGLHWGNRGAPAGCDSHDLDAAFCSANNTIYLDAAFIDQQYNDFGRGAVAVIIAHEYGHWAQTRLGLYGQPRLLKELQADCFAGMWFRATLANGTFADEDTRSAMSSLIDAGGNYADPFAADAHGDGSERADAFLSGVFGSDCRFK